MNKDKVIKDILTPFHQTTKWYNDGWYNDISDDNYTQRHDAMEISNNLIDYLYKNGYEISSKK